VSSTSEIANELPLLIADLFEAAGAMRRQGDRLAAVAGQTQARWQVLSILSDGQWTVPRVARRLGTTRQGVQRVADALRDDGLLTMEPNPDHERSPLLRLTQKGDQTLRAITDTARRWHERVAPRLDPSDLAATRRFIRAFIAEGDAGMRLSRQR